MVDVTEKCIHTEQTVPDSRQHNIYGNVVLKQELSNFTF